MNYRHMLKELVSENDGLILTSQVQNAKIPREYIHLMIKDGELEQISRGAYLTPDAFDDEMYRIQFRYKRGVFSHGTALFLHDLTDRTPLSYTMTFPSNYNSSSLKDEGIKTYFVKKEIILLGIIDGKTAFGRNIKTYNMERTICDLIRSRNKIDIQYLTNAIKKYSQKKEKNLNLLMEYAKVFKIQKIVRQYMEVIL